MLIDLVSMVALLIVGISIMIFLVFLPAIIELNRPKDSGPRMILNNESGLPEESIDKFQIVDIEGEHKFDDAFYGLTGSAIEALPNLEGLTFSLNNRFEFLH